MGTYGDVRAAHPNYDALKVGPGWTSSLPPSEGEPNRTWVRFGDLSLTEPGTDPAVWRFQRAVRTRYIRIRVRSESPVARLVVHRLDLTVRAATHAR